jgi:starvation-inducible outer membrane lipoprotein
MKNVKLLIVAVGVVSLTACSSVPALLPQPPKYTSQEQIPTVPDFEVHAMPRNEVIAASEQCSDSGMRPFVEYITQKTPFGRVMVPVNVHCNPIRKSERSGEPVSFKYVLR